MPVCTPLMTFCLRLWVVGGWAALSSLPVQLEFNHCVEERSMGKHCLLCHKFCDAFLLDGSPAPSVRPSSIYPKGEGRCSYAKIGSCLHPNNDIPLAVCGRCGVGLLHCLCQCNLEFKHGVEGRRIGKYCLNCHRFRDTFFLSGNLQYTPNESTN